MSFWPLELSLASGAQHGLESLGEALRLGQEFLGDLLEGPLVVVKTKEALEAWSEVCFWEGRFKTAPPHSPLKVPQTVLISPYIHTHSHRWTRQPRPPQPRPPWQPLTHGSLVKKLPRSNYVKRALHNPKFKLASFPHTPPSPPPFLWQLIYSFSTSCYDTQCYLQHLLISVLRPPFFFILCVN